MPDLQLPFQLQGITAPLPYQIILLDDRDMCVNNLHWDNNNDRLTAFDPGQPG